VKRPRLSIIIGLMIFTMLLAVSVRAQTLPADLNQSIHLNVECHSGTPLVLEFVLKAPEDMVRSVSFDFESDGEYDLSISRPTEEVIFRGVPFRKAGTYRTTAYVHTKEGNFTREYIIAYTEFVWGRDNFQFANDGKFEDSGDFVSDTLIEWAENQFGQLSQDEKVLLLSIMYDIYKGSIGRCYGFTGEQIYYITHPGNIPEQYGSIYWMREEDRTIFRNMDYIQNDIVFSNLLSGKISVQEQQNRDDLMRELDVIKESIGEGEPIIIGYLSNLMHHSMVVYGYFEDLFRGTVTLLTANNWEREQNNNTFSEDAENIVIEFHGETQSLRWYDLTKKKFRYPKSVFAVRREERYDLALDDFRALMERTKRGIIEAERSVIIVEKTETAFLENGEGKRQGYSKPRYYRELDEVSFKKIDYNYIFQFPASQEYRLFLKKRRYNEQLEEYKMVNLFGLIPTDEGITSVMLRDVPVEDEQDLVFLVDRDGIRPE